MPRILLVEDNEMNSDMLSRRLERRGYDVEIAADGRRGVEMARSWSPDLILMDMRLPDGTGSDVTRTLRSEQATKTIPVIALTAHALEGDREAALQAGCDDYDTKPVEMDRLLEKITSLLEKRAC